MDVDEGQPETVRVVCPECGAVTELDAPMADSPLAIGACPQCGDNIEVMLEDR